jgi:glycerate 2-kinase
MVQTLPAQRGVNPQTRRLLTTLFDSGVAAARGEDVLTAHSSVRDDAWHYDGPGGTLTMPLPRDGKVLVLGVGKAAASLALGLERVLGDRIDAGVVVVKHGHREQLRRIRIQEASHPVPDQSCLDATTELLRTIQGTTEADTIFFVLSGGASSLLVRPPPGLSLDAIQTTGRLLVNSGAAIDEINTVRKHLSAISGGRLRMHAPTTAFCTLAISDVVGDDAAAIGSGPTIPDPSTFADAIAVIDRHRLRDELPAEIVKHLESGARGDVPETPKDDGSYPSSPLRIVASNRVSLEACAQRARALGYRVEVVDGQMQGNTHEAAMRFASALRKAAGQGPTVLLAGGETTLAVQGSGRGGRNQELALVAALALRGVQNIGLLSAGTDGTDGPTDAAGAFADGSTIDRADSAGLDAQDHLRRNDSYPFWQALGDLHQTGPTGTNVMDLVIGVCYQSAP